jgi:hypothetical protein
MEVSDQIHGPLKKVPGTHWTEGWMGVRAGLDKNISPIPGIKPRALSSSLRLRLFYVSVVYRFVSILHGIGSEAR